MLILRLFIFSLLFTSSLLSKELFFDRLKAQMYGNIGLTSIAVGGDLNKNWTWDFFYGYVPRSHGGVHINTIAGKFNNHLFSINQNKRVYWGMGVMHVFNQRYRTSFRDEYPSNSYYQETSIHLFPYLGVERDQEFFHKDFKLYLEVGTLDVYFVDWYKNQETLGLSDVINFAFGMSYDF